MIDFSVIVLCYNCEEKALTHTIESIVCQEGIDFEIILADDASANDCLEFGEKLLKEKGFTKYKVLSHPVNVGTVQNIYDAMEMAEGKYLKCIGAGDLLFNKSTLKDIKQFMDSEKCTMCYGRMQAYRYNQETVEYLDYFVPSDIQAHIKGDKKRIKKNIIQNHGWIPGASMFYDNRKFKEYLKEIVGVVRYCEDLLQVNLLMKDEKLSYYPYGAMYYELGSGISTNKESGSYKRIKKDHEDFFDVMSEKYKGDRYIKKSLVMHKFTYMEGFGKKLIYILVNNPRYLLTCIRTKLQKKKYKINEKGMLQ